MKNIHFLFLFILFALLQKTDLFAQDSLLIWSKWIPDVGLLMFSPDNLKVSLINDASTNIILKIPSGDLDTTLPGVGRCEYTKNGNYLVCGSNILRVFNAQSYEQLDYFENDEFGLRGISISPDNKIASMYEFYGTMGYSIGFRIWDFKTGKIIKRKVFGRTDTIYHTGDILYGINALCYANNGQYLMVNKLVIKLDQKNNPVLHDEYAMILDPNTLDSIGVIRTGDKGMVPSKTGRYMAFSTYSGSVRIYDFIAKSVIFFTGSGTPYGGDMAFSSDDRYIGLTAGGVDIFNILEKQKIFSYNTGTPYTLAFSNDNNYIIVSADYVYLYRTPWITSVAESKNTINATFIYPNPSENYIILSFDLLQPNHTSIYLTDLKGMKIKDVLNDYIDIGNHKISIDLNNIASGPYFLTINSGTDSFCSKIIINK